MTDYEYLFATTVWQRLKRKIKGKIFVKVEDGETLMIKILNEDDETFVQTFDNFSNNFQKGVASKEIAGAVIKAYKQFIFNQMGQKYFYHD